MRSKPISTVDGLARRLFLFCLVTVCCWLPTQGHGGAAESAIGPVAVYKKYAVAFINGDLPRAANLAAKQALAVVRRKEELVRGGENITPPTATEILIIGELYSKSGDKLDIMAVLLARNPVPGLENPATTVHRQNVTLELLEAGWKVVYFIDDLEKCCL